MVEAVEVEEAEEEAEGGDEADDDDDGVVEEEATRSLSSFSRPIGIRSRLSSSASTAIPLDACNVPESAHPQGRPS